MSDSNDRETVNWLRSSLSSLSVLSMIMIDGVANHAAQTFSTNSKKHLDWPSETVMRYHIMSNVKEREPVNWLCSPLSSLSVLAMIMVNGVTSHAADT